MPEDASPLRVLLWSPAGSGNHYSGPGSFSYRMYSKAPRDRFEITLAHGFADQEDYELFREQHLIAPCDPGIASLYRFLRRGRQWLRRHAREFDVLHGLAGFHATVAPAYEAQRLGLPAVLFLANHRVELTDKPGLRGWLGLPRRRRAMVRQLSAVVAMSEAIHEELLEYDVPESRIARIPMGVDTDRFRPADDDTRQAVRGRLGWPQRPTFLFVGGVEKRKQPHLMVEAVGRAVAAGLDCQLVIAGPIHEEAYAESIEARSRELGIESHVIWFGFTEDIAPLYQASDLSGLISRKEGMPAAVVEAMASGLPAIVTGISGTTDLVTDGTHGRIVEPTADAVADALMDYLRAPELVRRHGQAARDRVVQRYSATAVLDAYEQLFRRVIARGEAGP